MYKEVSDFMTQYFPEYERHVEVDKKVDQLQILRSQSDALAGEILTSLARHYVPSDVATKRTMLTAKQLLTLIQKRELAAIFFKGQWYILAESLEDSGHVE